MQKGVSEYPVVVAVRLPASEAEQLRQAARADDRPVSVVLRRLVREALANNTIGGTMT